MKSPVQNRALFVCLVLVVGFSVLSVRLVYLQWIDRDESARQAALSLTHKEIIPARFGLIVDRNEEIMARNLPVATIIADQRHLTSEAPALLGAACALVKRNHDWTEASPEERAKLVRGAKRRLLEQYEGSDPEIAGMFLDHIVEVLAPELRMRRKDLRDRIMEEGRNDVIVAKDLREDEAEMIEELLRENRIQGFRFERKMRRWYPASDQATHVVGFVNHDGIGQCGIEQCMAKFLAGRDGYRIYRRDIRGLLLAHGGEKLLPPKLGLNVQITLDSGIQAIVEAELDACLKEFVAERGAVIIMDPKTGDILAMASRPHFDLNLREGYNENLAHMNYATEALFEPGSTFKIVAVAGALDTGVVSLDTEVDCGWGKRHIMSSFYVYDHHPYGDLSVSDVLMKSSNTGAYEIALRLGRTRFVDYLNRFGFKRKTGLGLGWEPAGMLAKPANPIDFSRMSYGYSVAVTPLQLCAAYGAIANDGVLMKPRLVQAVVANDGTVVERYDPQEAGRVMQVKTAVQLRQALATVVSEKGTAKRAKVPGFRVAGKTGTADKLLPDGRGYYDSRNVVSFVGMLPAEDPAFVCVVVIDDPRTEEVQLYGGTIAAPIFAKIASQIVTYLNITPTEPIEESEDAALLASKPGN